LRAAGVFFAEAHIRVHLYGKPTDMRKSYDGLQALARHAMGRDPLDGALYIFVNRRGSQLKCLYFDRSGFCIWVGVTGEWVMARLLALSGRVK
jgi:transposase